MTISDYARRFPQAEKWIVRCRACGRVGVRPDTPADAYIGLQRIAEPLEVGTTGLCADCARATGGT